MANRYTKTSLNNETLRFLYESGMTQKEVAEEMGTTQKVIWRIMRDAGINPRIAAPRNQHGKNNKNWKGSNAGYAAFHYRLRSLNGHPEKCEICGSSEPNRNYDWANLTGRYDDPSDYKRMCRSCHWKYDKKHLNFKGATGGRKAPKGGSKCLKTD